MCNFGVLEKHAWKPNGAPCFEWSGVKGPSFGVQKNNLKEPSKTNQRPRHTRKPDRKLYFIVCWDGRLIFNDRSLWRNIKIRFFSPRHPRASATLYLGITAGTKMGHWNLAQNGSASPAAEFSGSTGRRVFLVDGFSPPI